MAGARAVELIRGAALSTRFAKLPKSPLRPPEQEASPNLACPFLQ